jgi:hypothetical protein
MTKRHCGLKGLAGRDAFEHVDDERARLVQYHVERAVRFVVHRRSRPLEPALHRCRERADGGQALRVGRVAHA